jgi:hypothetical protein
METENRVKIMYVSMENVLSMFSIIGNNHDNMCYSIPVIPSLPLGYKILNCCWDYVRMTVGIVIFHDSFPIISVGEMPPRWDDGRYDVLQIPKSLEWLQIALKLLRSDPPSYGRTNRWLNAGFSQIDIDRLLALEAAQDP